MRRLARHLFTLCSAVSLLLCLAVCVLWVRSERTGLLGRLVARGRPERAGKGRCACEQRPTQLA